MIVEIEIPPAESEFVVQAALYLLEALVMLNCEVMRNVARDGGPNGDSKVPYLYEIEGLKYRPEPPGHERFDNCLTVLKRGWGDCDDLASFRAAELRHGGELGAKVRVVWRKGLRNYHAYVERTDGTIEDPCVLLLKREQARGGAQGLTIT